MEATFDVKDLDDMKRVQLQKLCKSVGIRAIGKVRMPSGVALLRRPPCLHESEAKTQGQIQYGGLSLLRCTFATIILALTREYHSTAFLIIRKGESIRSLRFEEILMRILRYILLLLMSVNKRP